MFHDWWSTVWIVETVETKLAIARYWPSAKSSSMFEAFSNFQWSIRISGEEKLHISRMSSGSTAKHLSVPELGIFETRQFPIRSFKSGSLWEWHSSLSTNSTNFPSGFRQKLKDLDLVDLCWSMLLYVDLCGSDLKKKHKNKPLLKRLKCCQLHLSTAPVLVIL